MTPAVSVVVATRNRSSRLAALLESLRAQTMSDFEVIVVDDASEDGTADLLREQEASGGLALRVMRHDVATGTATARNAGLRAAAAPLVGLTRHHCEAHP